MAENAEPLERHNCQLWDEVLWSVCLNFRPRVERYGIRRGVLGAGIWISAQFQGTGIPSRLLQSTPEGGVDLRLRRKSCTGNVARPRCYTVT